MHITRLSLILGLSMVLSQPATAADIQDGKKTFGEICARCHNMDNTEKLAPGLQGIGKRVTAQWLDLWIKNPEEMLKTDAYAQGLLANNRFNLHMPQIPKMQDDEKRANVIAYLLAEF